MRKRVRGGTAARFLAWTVLLCVPLFAGGCVVNLQALTEQDHYDRFIEDKAELATLQSPACGPISLQEAIARTLKYNIDSRLAQMEAFFSAEQLSAAKLQMLPRLAANAGYTMRNNESASSSMSYETGDMSLQPSYSTERRRGTSDLSLSWSLLDFGISYFQAKQQANRLLILMERRRRLTNNLVKDVITAYYRLASLERTRPQVEEAIVQAEKALETYRKQEEGRVGPLAGALEYQRSLINVLGQLRQLSTNLAIAKSHLAALMNLPHGSDFEVAPMTDDDFVPPQLAAELAQLEDLGVFLRPDLREEAYHARIDRDEVKKEMIRMLPGITVFGGINYDSNRYLVHSFWAEAGSRATIDLLGLAARYKQVKASKAQVKVARVRRLAATVAAMVQIDMSYFQYQQAIAQYGDSRELNRIDGKLLEISSAAAGARSIGGMELIMQSVTSVNSRLEMDRRMIDVLSAWANLYFSIGCDMMGVVSEEEDLSVLTRMAEAGLRRWLAGELPSMPGLPFRNACIASANAYGTLPSIATGDGGYDAAAPAAPGKQERPLAEGLVSVRENMMPRAKPEAAAVTAAPAERELPVAVPETVVPEPVASPMSTAAVVAEPVAPPMPPASPRRMVEDAAPPAPARKPLRPALKVSAPKVSISSSPAAKEPGTIALPSEIDRLEAGGKVSSSHTLGY